VSLAMENHDDSDRELIGVTMIEEWQNGVRVLVMLSLLLAAGGVTGESAMGVCCSDPGRVVFRCRMARGLHSPCGCDRSGHLWRLHNRPRDAPERARERVMKRLLIVGILLVATSVVAGHCNIQLQRDRAQ
jgi:hypothetical protein